MKLLATGAALAGAALVGTRHAPPPDVTYVAHLHSINAAASKMQPSGDITFTTHGDSLTIRVRMHNVPPNIEHWQHFHGFPDGHQSACPTAAADTTGEGLVDIRETEPAAGTTMVPFNADPIAMEIPTHTYPDAGAQGTYNYTKTVALADLQKAFGV